MNSDISVTIYVIEMNCPMCVPKVPFEGRVSQIVNERPSYHFMSKIGYHFFLISIFSISTFHKIETKKYIKILRDTSLHHDLINAHLKFELDMSDRD